MSHIVGTVQTLSSPIKIGPDSGSPPSAPNTWTINFSHEIAPGGTKFLMLHLNASGMKPNDRLEVDLGYDKDVFTSTDGAEFWTRPINIHVLPGGVVPVRYITSSTTTGSVLLDKYGRGESHMGEPGHPSISNCDPFLPGPSYIEPTYDPFWYCTNPPKWENVACISPETDVRARVARSVGMIISVEGDVISTCSVTLIDADKVLTAGHCHTPDEALSSSITFDYQTDCMGNKPSGYNAKFYKVKSVLKHHYDGVVDYSLLQLANPPAGIPAIQLRHDIPAVGEKVFGVHHPNGAVKKLSIPHPGFDTLLSSDSTKVTVHSDFHVSGGSSGSGLFDTAGRILGVLSNGDPCRGTPLRYFPTASILADIAPAPPPPVTRDVMVVFDRSGSMSMDDGTGRKKIDAARDAVSLFVQLVRSGVGNRIGLVSFSTTASSPADFNLSDVTDANKTLLIGPPPYFQGKVGNILPSGLTTIGGGLDEARKQFPAPGSNPRTILLLSDGMQNKEPLVSKVESLLTGINIHAIGYGTEANLDGELLANLTKTHNGMYIRAGNGLALEKFFSHAFGNIFEAGLLMDPEYFLPENKQRAEPVPFNICGEESITVVVGWDRSDAELRVKVTTPSGVSVTGQSSSVETSKGITWVFLRIPLPYRSERDGVWNVIVSRPDGGGEFPPPKPDLNYFINVIPTGGPKLSKIPDIKRYYTGDSINPLINIRYDDGSWPKNANVRVTVSRPNRSAGSILSNSKLKASETLNGDTIPERQSTLMALERESGQPVINYIEETFDLFDDAENTDGIFEASAIFGKPFKDLLTKEGNYTFHFRASYGQGCASTRELFWTLHVDVGIDPTQTSVTTSVVGTSQDGCIELRVSLIPRDKYGNNLGPGRLEAISVTGMAGSKVTGPVRDNGDGSYVVDMCWDQELSGSPGVIINQPERSPVEIPFPVPEGIEKYVYSVKFICGIQEENSCQCGPVRPGEYATDINIHNYHDKNVIVDQHVLPVVFAGAVTGREPCYVGRKTSNRIILPPHSATMNDCCRLSELLLGGKSNSNLPLTIGFLEIISRHPINISAVYTVTNKKSGSIGMDVKQIQGIRTN
ncbi:trypsin-like peptidase domain-containing protein [Bacillus cereus]|uniref:trypsin-like peptidase domain-containing protein n=1 Tax=Bacillus cereus TaxID=1396 RepID=UPI000BF62032|nr:trypsin-like peptidase domain-containing protein [Bacillus cereus]PFO99882.1 hypothetical protein COJ97_15320 [Bacillus cereus]